MHESQYKRNRSRESYATAGAVGALRRAALTPDRRTITAAARNATLQKYLDQVPAEITDPADRMDRALMLRRADMISLSQRAATARKRQAEARQAARQAEDELAVLEDESA